MRLGRQLRSYEHAAEEQAMRSRQQMSLVLAATDLRSAAA